MSIVSTISTAVSCQGLKKKKRERPCSDLLSSQPRYFSLLNLGLVAVVLFCLAGRAYSQCSNPANADRRGELQAGKHPGRVGRIHRGCRRPDDPGLRHRHQREPRRHGLLQDQHRRPCIHDRHLPHGLLRGLGARKVATISPSATLPQTQPACLQGRYLWTD